MNTLIVHAIADVRHAELYAAASAASAASAAPVVAHRRVPLAAGMRRRLGALLVEAGLHLMTRAESAPRVSSRFV